MFSQVRYSLNPVRMPIELTVDGSLYVRAYNGQSSRWYKAARAQKCGRVSVGGIEKDVVFEPVEGTIDEAIDAAYRAKYASSPY